MELSLPVPGHSRIRDKAPLQEQVPVIVAVAVASPDVGASVATGSELFQQALCAQITPPVILGLDLFPQVGYSEFGQVFDSDHRPPKATRLWRACPPCAFVVVVQGRIRPSCPPWEFIQIMLRYPGHHQGLFILTGRL